MTVRLRDDAINGQTCFLVYYLYFIMCAVDDRMAALSAGVSRTSLSVCGEFV